MADFKVYKMNALPASPAANAMYVIKDSSSCKIYITNTAGTPLPLQPGTAAGIDAVLEAGNQTARSMTVGSVRVTDSSTYDNYIDKNGLFANGSDMAFYPVSALTTNASVVGLLTTRNSGFQGISAAIAGIDNTDSGDGNSESWGGFFSSVKSAGAFSIQGPMHITGINVLSASSSSYTCSSTDYLVLTNAVTDDLYLPSSPGTGRMIIIKANGAGITIHGNGNQIIGAAGALTNSVGIGNGNGEFFIFSGGAWLQFHTH